MLNDDLYEIEIDRLKQSVKRLSGENKELRKQLFIYLSACFAISLISCCMMMYMVISNNKQVLVYLNEEQLISETTIQETNDSSRSDEELSFDISIDNQTDDEVTEPVIVESTERNTEFTVDDEDFDVLRSDEPSSSVTNNTREPARIEDTFSIPTETPEEGFGLPSFSDSSEKKIIRYVVKKNDNLWKIALKFYGSSRYIQKIKRDNSLRSDHLKPGERLILLIED